MQQTQRIGFDLQEDFPGLYVTYLATKTELTRVLGVSRTTIISWDSVATSLIDDYRKAYPVVDGDRDCQAPLVPYQIWVLSRIQRVLKMLRRISRLEHYIQEYPEYFSIETYESKIGVAA